MNINIHIIATETGKPNLVYMYMYLWQLNKCVLKWYDGLTAMYMIGGMLPSLACLQSSKSN